MHQEMQIPTSGIRLDYLSGLKSLIGIASFSKAEAGTAAYLREWIEMAGITTAQVGNNVWAQNRHFSSGKPTIMLVSHHDTVRPAAGYTRDPFLPEIENGRLYGLGSNDAGGPLVCMAAAFATFYERADLPFNLIWVAAAEEEISGQGGIESVLPHLPTISCAMVGEPTGMQLAVAEKGLMVLDAYNTGKSGHAAREEGINALYAALEDIERIRKYRFPEISEWLGPVKMSVTCIETSNKAHNVVPDTCHWVVDVRLTDAYTPEAVLEALRAQVQARLEPRSMRLRATGIALEHPLVRAGLALGKQAYGSPTLSDKALLPFPALKMGPGESARSHTADEYILLTELAEGYAGYCAMLESIAHKSVQI